MIKGYPHMTLGQRKNSVLLNDFQQTGTLLCLQSPLVLKYAGPNDVSKSEHACPVPETFGDYISKCSQFGDYISKFGQISK